MPAYQFVTDQGEQIELHMSFAEFDKRVKNDKIKLDDGREARYDWSGHAFISTVPANYPCVCTAAGVAPSQVKEHVEHLRKMGCGFVEHNKDGDIVFNDKRQRKQVLEALGMFDRRASYDDPQPKHRTKSCKSFVR